MHCAAIACMMTCGLDALVRRLFVPHACTVCEALDMGKSLP